MFFLVVFWLSAVFSVCFSLFGCLVSNCFVVWLLGQLVGGLVGGLVVCCSNLVGRWSLVVGRLFVCSFVWLFGCLVVWLFGCLVVWLFGCLDVWLLGCWVVGLFGCLVVWLLGLLGC